MAVLATILANANRDPKKRGTPFAPMEFMFTDAQTRQEQTDLETLAFFESKVESKDGG